MLNLLPPQQKKKLRLDLLNQVVITTTMAVIFMIFILIVLLLVMQGFLSTNLSDLEEELGFWQSKTEIKELESLEKKVEELNKNLIFLDKKQKQQIKFSLILEDIVKDVSPGVRFENVLIRETGEVSINGYAITRDTLLAFKKNLEEASYVSDFDFPLSNLTKTKDINFSVSFKLLE